MAFPREHLATGEFSTINLRSSRGADEACGDQHGATEQAVGDDKEDIVFFALHPEETFRNGGFFLHLGRKSFVFLLAGLSRSCAEGQSQWQHIE